jgi:hypothetical protein
MLKNCVNLLTSTFEMLPIDGGQLLMVMYQEIYNCSIFYDGKRKDAKVYGCMSLNEKQVVHLQ